MSTFTPITLKGVISSSANGLVYGENDGAGMASQYQTYDLVISPITPQNIGDGSTRQANQYNGIDIEVGMWISDNSGNSILRIKSISEKSTTAVSCTVEDVDMLSFRLNNVNSFSTNSDVVIFKQNSEGEAIIADTSAFIPGGLDKVQSRFVVNEADDRVKFSHSSAPSVDKGDIVTVNSSGDLVKFGTAGGSDIKLGTVLEKIRGGKDIFVKPFNDIIRNYKDPESLTANPGGIYYTDLNLPGEITTATGGKGSYMHLNTAIPSSQVAGSALPGATDVVEINGVTVFDGPNGDSVADIDAFRILINNASASTNVTATSAATPVSVQGGDFEPTYAANDYYSGSDSYVVTGIQGQAPAIAEITIGDGVNPPQTILFDNPDDTLELGGTYDVISPTAMLTKFQDAITAGSLDLVAELVGMDSYDGQTVKISTTGSATQVVLTNVSPAAFGTNAVGASSWTGIGMSATVGSPVLTLTRASGGPIEITGSPISGGWINTNGAVSSQSGRVPYLLLIESEGGAVEATGVTFKEEVVPTTTTTDGDSTGGAITYTPFEDSDVTVRVNGLQCDIGDGAKDKPCYFSGDGGTTARAIADITANDTLYWVGSIAGYELDPTDDLEIQYLASSFDV
jgi:hypothetical protein